MMIEDLNEAIKNSWCRETCLPRLQDNWSPEIPCYGQCVPTSLVVQDYFDGEILYCKHRKHYWNLVDGEEIDLTKNQFGEKEICFDDKRSRGYLLSCKHGKVEERYNILKQKTTNEIKKNILIEAMKDFGEKYKEKYGNRLFLIDLGKELDENFEIPKIDPIILSEDNSELLTNGLDFDQLKNKREKFFLKEFKRLNPPEEDYPENNHPRWEKSLYSSSTDKAMGIPFAKIEGDENFIFGSKKTGVGSMIIMEKYESGERMFYHYFKINE